MAPRHPITLFKVFLFGLVVTCCDLWVPGLSHASAPAKPRKEMNPSAARPLASDMSVPTVRWEIASKHLPPVVSDKAVETRAKKPSHSARVSRKTGRKKLKLRAQPMVVVEPQPLIPASVAHFGMLEQPQRYDPGRDRRTGRIVIPQAAGLLHDHFQELDQNHDGLIDPFERVTGRLDIERDAANR